jgi:hypothetical protein
VVAFCDRSKWSSIEQSKYADKEMNELWISVFFLVHKHWCMKWNFILLEFVLCLACLELLFAVLSVSFFGSIIF